jgi:hypothetical protein
MGVTSKEGLAVVSRILAEVSGCKYLYRSIVSGAFVACVTDYGMAKPAETKDEIIDEVFRVLNEA